MNQIVRQFEIIEGSLGSDVALTNDRTNDPLTTPGFWLLTDELATLAGVAPRITQRALKSRRWRGADLVVREVASNVGRGGKMLQVHVDSLPGDLRKAWYLEHGIDLHEKTNPATGETILVTEQKFERDARHDERLRVARWRLDIIRPVLSQPAYARGREALLRELSEIERLGPDGKNRTVSRAQLYRWVQDYEKDNAGLIGLMPKEKADKGRKYTVVTRVWDGFFGGHIPEGDQQQIGEDLTHYIRSLWGSGERGKRAIAEKSTTWLIERSRKLGVVTFDALDLGRPVTKAGTGTQFEVCAVPTRRAYDEKKYAVLAVKRKDNARFQDEFVPHILRDYSGYKPRDIIVGDVHPTDVMLKREDGSQIYPKAIAWMDIATNEMFMVFVFLEKGEGIKREHIAMAFELLVREWGLPKLLYLDNGSEYSWDAMIDGFTQLSKLTEGAFSVADLGGNSEVRDRVLNSRQSVIRSLAYNAKGKPKIEGAFGNIEKVQFALLPGWTAGDRMRKKTHAKGKDPVAFPGTRQEFLEAASIQLEWYHKRPQHGRLDGRSPNEALRDFINDGWGKTTLSNPDVLKLAFAEEHTRVPKSGRVSYKSRHGETRDYFADELMNRYDAITLRVPAWNPEFVFCFDGEEFICIAHPERRFGVLDPRGAQELGRRKKYHAREISELAKHCALLDLVAETARHNQHMADTPEAPVGTSISVPMLERMSAAAEEERKALADEAARPKPRVPQQFKTGPNEALNNLKYAEDDDE